MHISSLFHSALVTLSLASFACLPACSKKEEDKGAEVTAESISADDTITEQHDAASVTWLVQPDGQVKAKIMAPGGEPLDKDVTGKLIVQPNTEGAKPVTADLQFDAKAGLYTAVIPKLESDMTPVSYELGVKGKPVKGALYLPKGGTKELVLTAKATEEVKIPKDKKGPNGGILQVAGDDMLEIVANEKTGETRVYVLDDDYKPIPIGKRKVQLGVVGEVPETVYLNPEPKGLFFTGKLKGKVHPHKVTVMLYPENHPEPVVVLCGWHPGTVIVVGPSAPVIAMFVVANWSPVIVVGAPAPPVIVIKGKGHHDHHDHHDHHHHDHHGPGHGIHLHLH
jgi:hypothetical protein